ncbi:hypothetical protein [Angustibacter luteus]
MLVDVIVSAPSMGGTVQIREGHQPGDWITGLRVASNGLEVDPSVSS